MARRVLVLAFFLILLTTLLLASLTPRASAGGEECHCPGPGGARVSVGVYVDGTKGADTRSNEGSDDDVITGDWACRCRGDRGGCFCQLYVIVTVGGQVPEGGRKPGFSWWFRVEYVEWEVELYVREWNSAANDWGPWELKDTWSGRRENLGPYRFRDPKDGYGFRLAEKVWNLKDLGKARWKLELRIKAKLTAHAEKCVVEAHTAMWRWRKGAAMVVEAALRTPLSW